MSKKVSLICCDGNKVEVEEAVAMQSETIKRTLEDISTENEMPLPNVNSKTMLKLLEYMNKQHMDDNEDLKNWACKFITSLNKDELFLILLATHYLEINKLYDLACQRVADTIKGMNPQEIRDYFSIENDFIPEEEKQLREENGV